MTNKQTNGVHHITAIAGPSQENIDFYVGVLGLRLVKKTVNFDDPGTYHFYFGDEKGTPGTILTFFPWKNIPQGRVGSGQVGFTTFGVPTGALSFWEKRLSDFGYQTETETRFGETYLQFEDPHGLKLELVEREDGPENTWEFNGVTSDVAIKGFGGAVLYSGAPQKTAELLEEGLGFEKVGEEDRYLRFRSKSDIGNIIDVPVKAFPRGEMGAGTVHHIAWRVDDYEDQQDWRSYIQEHGLRPTEILDRQYFTSIYFREWGGILFEVATDTPGFDTDETVDHLGEELKLPEWLEQHRNQIESLVDSIEVREVKPKK
ncbi:ring-cleaving dioxygenase [Aquisalibacillus elongatus]|uniref:Glyoxalase family protein n=1 Tax=Aquisalibacillus elongatus TaxID=485577 RepID=A0A3N5B7C6_9BACI|nr:ring-cleaving dioxygenase [Aquisalibacillus elongatus]RPF53344.1 glyoxalase family protein [Aquisalibacillus elongatus]